MAYLDKLNTFAFLGEVSTKMIGPDEINQQFMYAVEPNHFYKVTIYADADGKRSPKLVESHFVPSSTKGESKKMYSLLPVAPITDKARRSLAYTSGHTNN
jgi:hypothetical protein